MDESGFRAELAAGGYAGPELVAIEANQYNPEHIHDFAVHLLILDGELNITVDGVTTSCRAGDTFKLAAGIPHCEQYGPQGANVLVGRLSAQAAASA